MIHIIDNYYIQASKKDYVLVRERPEPDEDGNKQYSFVGYADTIKHAVRRCNKEYQRNSFDRDECIELDKAILRLEGINREFQEILERLLGGKE